MFRREWIFLAVFFALSGVSSCCNLLPSALLFDLNPPYVWISRFYSGPNGSGTHVVTSGPEVSFDLQVVSFYNMQEYRYQFGRFGSLDCNNLSQYSPWISRAERLTKDFSAEPDGELQICILARGTDKCGTMLFQTTPSIYRWNKDTQISPFSISAPTGIQNSLTMNIEWTASADADRYDLSISQNASGASPLQIFTNITGTEQEFTAPAEGTYYIFMSAKDPAGNIVNASNNGLSVVLDTTPPGSFMITSPTGTVSTMSPTVSLQSAADANQYHIAVATQSDCQSGSVVFEQTVDAPSTQVSVPTAGTFYICAEAMDAAMNATPASNNGSSFVVQAQQEYVLRDHVTDTSCYNNSSALYHYNDPGDRDGVLATKFVGQGGILKRVGAIFSDSDCNNFNAGHIENMQLSLAFYENTAVFLADPFLQNQPDGSASFRVNVAKLHTSPGDPQYYLNPVRITSHGTEQFYVETDVSALNIQTVNGQEHLVALWLSSDSALDGTAWIALSNGCPGQVGTLPDYYRSKNNNPEILAGTLQAGGAPLNFGAYFVSEMH